MFVWSSLKVPDPTILHSVLGLWTLTFKTYGFWSSHFLTHGLSLLGTSWLNWQCFAFFYLHSFNTDIFTLFECVTIRLSGAWQTYLIHIKHFCWLHLTIIAWPTDSVCSVSTLNCQYYLMLCCETRRLANLHPMTHLHCLSISSLSCSYLLPTWPSLATLEEGSCNDNMTCTGGCRYSFMYSWWWVRKAPETCRVTLQWNKIDCEQLHFVGLL